jgi:putative oxidoreductase
MLANLFSTADDPVLTVVRIVFGIVIFAHGAQKMLGWFGGYGFKGTMEFFTKQMKIPAVFAFLAIAAEFFGGLGLILGLLTRIAALGVGVNMLVAIFAVHRQFGFFANWFGTQKGEGFEYHLLALLLVILLIAKGAGAFSLDLTLYHSFVAG